MWLQWWEYLVNIVVCVADQAIGEEALEDVGREERALINKLQQHKWTECVRV